MPGLMETWQGPRLDHGFREYQAVVTLVLLTGDDGAVIPAGTEGAIVDIAPGMDWLCVEFFKPVGVVGMTPEHLRPLPSASPAFRELDRVRTVVDVIEEGQRLPAGSTGTIVDVGRTPGWYEVEFTQPFQAVVTLTNVQIAPVA